MAATVPPRDKTFQEVSLDLIQALGKNDQNQATAASRELKNTTDLASQYAWLKKWSDELIPSGSMFRLTGPREEVSEKTVASDFIKDLDKLRGVLTGMDIGKDDGKESPPQLTEAEREKKQREVDGTIGRLRDFNVALPRDSRELSQTRIRELSDPDLIELHRELNELVDEHCPRPSRDRVKHLDGLRRRRKDHPDAPDEVKKLAGYTDILRLHEEKVEELIEQLEALPQPKDKGGKNGNGTKSPDKKKNDQETPQGTPPDPMDVWETQALFNELKELNPDHRLFKAKQELSAEDLATQERVDKLMARLQAEVNEERHLAEHAQNQPAAQDEPPGAQPQQPSGWWRSFLILVAKLALWLLIGIAAASIVIVAMNVVMEGLSTSAVAPETPAGTDEIDNVLERLERLSQ